MVRAILVGTRKGLFTLSRSSAGWAVERVDFLGDPVQMVLHDTRDEATYAALDLGHFGNKLHRRDAGGEFTEIPVPSYPEKPESEDDDLGAQNMKPVPWDLKGIWALESAGPDKAGALWCGTLPGGLFRSDDRGNTWQLNEPLWHSDDRRAWFGGGADWPALHSVCVDPRDSDRVLIGVSCGGTWISEDGGVSWTVSSHGMRAEFMPPDEAGNPGVQDPHIVVQCPSAPDVYYTQHHCGIWKSDNGGTQWNEITADAPSRFGFAVVVHPNDPDTAWFVPAVKDEARYAVGGTLCVTRTTDGGKTLQVLRNGLPQEHAYDITLRHALAVDRTGTTLCFGTTTGNVFVSEDGGDSWSLVSGHLPPVYVVKMID